MISILNIFSKKFDIVKYIQSSGLKVFSYTAKNAEDLALASALKIDGVFVDNLEEALNFFK